MLANSSEWYYFESGLQFGTMKYSNVGDTTMAGSQYSIVSLSTAPSFIQFSPYYLREDSINKEVLIRDFNGDDVILYNFNLLPGDTFQKPTTINGGFAQLILDSISNDFSSIPSNSLQFCGNNVDSSIIGFPSPKIFHFNKDIWIEGIGSMRHLIYNDWECYKFLSCHFDNNGTRDLYFSTYFGDSHLHGDCFTNYLAGINSSDISNSFITISPNPSSGKNISVAGEGLNSIKIYSIHGQLIKTAAVKNDAIELNLENQPKGIYLIKAQFENGEVVSRKLMLIR